LCRSGHKIQWLVRYVQLVCILIAKNLGKNFGSIVAY
jgi:hypothetical protein